MKTGGIGIFGVIAVVGISTLLGMNPLDILGQLEQQGALAPLGTQENTREFEGEDAYERFGKQVTGSLDGYWMQFVDGYKPATLVLFRDRTSSACGGALSMAGPHYCPVDENIYLDERFFDELKDELGATGGDVAQAYVIAHEAGHHVQNILGRISGDGSSEESIATELTADCFAGAWLGSLQSENIFEENEILEAVDAAGAVGDDNIQRRTEGTVRPETWTHGSAEQRRASVMRGYRNFQDPSACLE